MSVSFLYFFFPSFLADTSFYYSFLPVFHFPPYYLCLFFLDLKIKGGNHNPLEVYGGGYWMLVVYHKGGKCVWHLFFFDKKKIGIYSTQWNVIPGLHCLCSLETIYSHIHLFWVLPGLSGQVPSQTVICKWMSVGWGRECACYYFVFVSNTNSKNCSPHS